jgi:ABC-type uncharacterized transport system involved in gliding motility auxiliary subunit
MAVNAMTTTVPGLTVSPLIRTSGGPPVSWLETDIKPGLQGSIQLQYDADKDQPGPVNVALSVGPDDTATPVTATNQTKPRIVVFGDADFPSNVLMQDQLPFYNTDLFDNSVGWLTGARELVALQPKAPDSPRTVALDVGQKNLVFMATVFGLPILVALFGILNWWRRR